MTSNLSVIDQMQTLIQQWEDTDDDKVLFLECYRMMTGNVLEALDKQVFCDPVWVKQLIDHFAEYYFLALQAYEQNPKNAPTVWQLAHNAASDPEITALQNLLLGVNAHINYDLVLTLDDLLRSEWSSHSEQERANRYSDHCRINDIIGQTIDALQDQVLDPAMPIMEIVDRLLGPVDEILISRLIAHWREIVWMNADRLLALNDFDQQVELIQQIEQEALETGKFIYHKPVVFDL